jgi:hypothetical protein
MLNQLIYDGVEIQEIVEDTVWVGNYMIKSYLRDTGKIEKYHDTVYDSRIQVYCDTVVVYDTKRKYIPLPFRIGYFNNNDKLDLYISYAPWEAYYWIVEFDSLEYKQKEYFIDSVD